MSKLMINQEAVGEVLLPRLKEDSLRAAEPHIQAALRAIEADIRREVAARLIGYIEERVSFYHNRNELVIHFGKMPDRANAETPDEH
jgi:predicted component of type VI protein secretion system